MPPLGIPRRRAAAQPIHVRAERYIRERWDARACERMAVGVNSEVWRVDLGHESLIARFWRIEEHRDLAAECAHALGLVAALGLPAPRLLDTDFGPRAAAHGFRVTVEEHIPGRHLRLEDLGERRVVEQIASLLIRLHSMTSDVAGRPWSRHNREHPWERWMTDRARVLVDRARRLGLADRATAKELGEWFASRRPRLREVSPLCLVHGDLQPANLLMDDRGRVTLIDFATLSFAPRVLELASAHNAFELVARGAFAPILEEYLRREQGTGNKEQDEGAIERMWREHGAHFRAFDQLRRAVSAQRKVGKRRHIGRRDVYAHKAELFWGLLLETAGIREIRG